MLDVVTLGETMLRLTPPNLQRIEQSTNFDIHIGGSESNMAVGLARLGMHVAWLSRMTDNALGRHIVQQIRAHGVDVSCVNWTSEDRVGLYFVEEGKSPRGNHVIYDRADSAVSKITPNDLPVDLFQPNAARCLHLTGITLALSDSARQTAQAALDLAKLAGWQFSFDTNFRSLLWDAATARRACEPFFQAADVLFIPRRDAITLFDMPDVATAPDILTHLRVLYPHTLFVITLGGEGAIAQTADTNEVVHQSVYAAEPVGRIGGGDAFTAGFLYAYLKEFDVATALKWGAATAAIKYTIRGDLPLIDREQVARLVDAAGTGHFR
jgi:2-dehydro-3-deoxygluconokinase